MNKRSFIEYELRKKILLLLILTGLIALAAFVAERRTDTVPDGYLLRGSYGEGTRTEELVATYDGKDHAMAVTVEARAYTEEEIASHFSDTERRLAGQVFTGIEQNHVDTDLLLPDALDNDPVMISWSTDRESILSWDGRIGEDVPESGTPVTLQATLLLQGTRREISYPLIVFPARLDEEEATDRALHHALRDTDPAKETLPLPSRIGDKTILWSRRYATRPLLILLSGTLGAVFLICHAREKQRADRERQRLSMAQDYPMIVNKLVLYLGAGMSLRHTLEKMTRDYERSIPKKGTRSGYEEIRTTVREMQNGYAEAEAYARMGRRTIHPRYKTLSTLLCDNLKKGGPELLVLMKKEANDAWDQRRKDARIRGEIAGTKLLGPMLIMLGTILVILMVPAALTLF